MVDLGAGYRAVFQAIGVLDAHALVHSVGKQPSFLGLERINQALTSKSIVVDDIESPAVEGQPAGVLDPQGTQGARGRVAPQRDFLRIHVGVDDGNQGRMVLEDRDFLFQVVFE